MPTMTNTEAAIKSTAAALEGPLSNEAEVVNAWEAAKDLAYAVKDDMAANPGVDISQTPAYQQAERLMKNYESAATDLGDDGFRNHSSSDAVRTLAEVVESRGFLGAMEVTKPPGLR